MAESIISEEEFDLRITGGGIEVKRKINGRTLAGLMAVVLGRQLVDDPSSSLDNNTTDATGILPHSSMNLRHYLDTVKASRKPDQIVAIGHYLSLNGSQTDFSRDDVRSHFKVAREPMPKNFSRDFSLAVKAGMLAGVYQKPGSFYVTKSGIKAVEGHFSRNKQKS